MSEFERYRRRNFWEVGDLSDRLKNEGKDYKELKEGEVYEYGLNNHDYSIHILGFGMPKSNYLLESEIRPIVRIDIHFFGELQDSTAGILLGTSITGDGAGLCSYLPPAGHDYVACMVEALPPSQQVVDEDPGEYIPGYGIHYDADRPKVILVSEVND